MPPSEFELQVVISEDIDQIAEFMSNLVGYSNEWHKENEMEGNWTSTFSHPAKGSQREGYKTIILKMTTLKDRGLMVHELVHVLFHLQKFTSQEIHQDSQEWVAMFMEMMFNELCKPNYEKIKKPKPTK